MVRMFITNAVVSKGYNGAPALNYSEKGESKFVGFKVGTSVYDKHAENNRRYIYISIKAFNGIASRIESMKLEAGKYVNITGRYDVEEWNDKNTNEKKSSPVLYVEEIEYCFSGEGKNNGDKNNAPTPGGDTQTSPSGSSTPPATPSEDSEQSSNFTGFANFGGANPYYPES